MKRYPLLYPFLFAANFVLTTTATNLAQIPLGFVFRPLVIVLSLTMLLLLGLCRWLHDHNRASWLAFLVLVGVLYFQPFHTLTSWVFLRSFSLERYLLSFTFWAALLIFLGTSAVWNRLAPHAWQLTSLLNIIAMVILVVPIFGILQFVLSDIGNYRYQSPKFSQIRLQTTLENPPDIYYIVLDGYARDDVLSALYGYDNQALLEDLARRGFFVASGAQSNYMHTFLSVAATLNFDYLEEIAQPLVNSSARVPLLGLIEHSRSRVSLENAGYRSVALSSGLIFTEIDSADDYLSPHPSSLNELEGLLLSNTLLHLPFELMGQEAYLPGYRAHQERILYAFDALSQMPAVAGPKFVFAHIIAPHPPFVFDRAGNAIQPDRTYFLGDADGYRGSTVEYLQQYVDELIFINTRLQKTLDEIMENSATPPIIIIQADHGPGAYLRWDSAEESCLWERFSIFSAYYLPGDASERLYETITPVNSFRVIFDAYFDAELGLLPDRSYFSSWNKPYAFQDVTESSRLPCTLP